MFLYHGSSVKVEYPKILVPKRFLDFGKGFYLTSDYQQAQKWAVRTTERREIGTPTISVFSFDETALNEMKVLFFKRADENWLKYVALNRTQPPENDFYDIVIGPVADDQTFRTITDFLNGYFNEEIAIKLLETQNLKDQYAFKTENSLKCLRFERCDLL